MKEVHVGEFTCCEMPQQYSVTLLPVLNKKHSWGGIFGHNQDIFS